jgi:type I restriction enzyme, S subunit
VGIRKIFEAKETTITMKRYPEYKDSGVEWIGEIPKSWNASILKRYLSQIKDGTHGSYNRVSNGYPLLSAKNVFNEGIKIDDIESFISFEDYCEITKNGFPQFGDLLVTCVGTIGRTFVYNLEKTFAFQRSVSFLRFKGDSYNLYYKYFIQSDFYLNYLTSVAKTSAQSGVYMGDLERSTILYPPINEQIVIANFLDKKSRQIDDLIEKKQKLIELLKEERIAIINNAVTKGLDPTVPMKDSCIAWISKIPNHWRIKKIKHNTYVKGRIGWQGLKSDEYLTEGFAYLVTGTDFINGVVNWSTCFHVDQSRFDEDRYIQLVEGDLLITKDGTIGKIAIVKNMDKPSTLNSGIFLVRPLNDDYSTDFLFWILSSSVFSGFFDYHKSGSTISHLYQNVFVEFSFPIPAMNEQAHIVSFLEKKTEEINILISKEKVMIDQLQEYKISLINEAVTGKIDVRDYQIDHD